MKETMQSFPPHEFMFSGTQPLRRKQMVAFVTVGSIMDYVEIKAAWCQWF